MSVPSIVNLATAVPDRKYDQTEIAEKYLLRLPSQSHARAVRTIFKRTGVETRYATADEAFFSQPRSTQERNDLYMEAAVPLGRKVLTKLFEQSDYTPQDVDTFAVVSCTGYSVPGLDLHLAQQMGMRPDLRRTCILGMGCYGAIPGLRYAYDAVTSGHNRVALVMALELCSLHLQFDGAIESIVSAALFSDGASAALVTYDKPRFNETAPRLLNFKTQCAYDTLDAMSFNLTDSGFRMYLSSYVPELLASNVEAFVDDLLGDCHIQREEIHSWAIHPGSQKIVEFVQQQLDIQPEKVASSYAILRDYGNMSSATILFVLQHIRQTQCPPRGSYGVLLAFGPGLTMEGILVQW
jgi:predicted naringenin-chalcone synthase